MRGVIDILGVGYQGRTQAEVIDDLRAQAVTVLVDVRLTPLSRRTGLSKTALALAVRAAGIEYLHMRELGNPKTNRAGFADIGGPLGLAARKHYARLLNNQAANEALDLLATRAASQRVALLCFESDQDTCHRAVIIEAVLARAAERTAAQNRAKLAASVDLG